jgi:CHAD domain-containing protein
LKKMPATFFILLHWKKQQNVFLQNLAKLTNKRETEAIHDLRVAVKKLRSYLKLLTILSIKIDRSGFEKTEHLFSALGKHRDIEMGLMLMQAFEKENRITYTAFRFHLKVALQQTGIWVQNALSNYDEKKLTGLTRQLEQQLKETNTEKLIDTTGVILNKEIKKLKRLTKHLATQPHEVRKMLKNIFYWISIYPQNILTNSQVKKLRKSLDLLGDWQDHEMLHRKIKHFRKDFVPALKEEYLLLKELEKSIEDKMEAMLKKADKNIQSSFSESLDSGIGRVLLSSKKIRGNNGAN